MNGRTWSVTGLLVAGLLLLICSGCGTSAPVAQSGPPQPSVETTQEPPATATIPGPPAPSTIPGPPAAAPATDPQVFGPPQTQPTPPAEAAPPANLPLTPPDPPATPTETVKADVGVGAKGRSLDAYEGPIVTPAKAYFAVREKAIFQIAIPQAIQLYKAENPIPLTFEEFKQNVLDPNKIKLPPLPPGHSYEWNPEEEQLMVRRPMK